MGVGRRRSKDLGLPPRMYRKGGRYYHVHKGKWTSLGPDLAKARGEWARLENAGSGEGTIGSLIDRYLLSKYFTERAENTRRNYARMAEVLRKCFGHLQVRVIKPQHVAEYLDTHRFPKLANNEIGLLSTIYEKALRWGLADTNPCSGVRRNPIRRRERYISDAEYAKVWEAALPLVRVAMDLAYATGLRIGDLCRIRWSDVRDGALYVRQQKTGDEVAFEVTEGLQAILERARRLKPRLRPTVLCNRSGRPCNTKVLSESFSSAAKRAGVLDAHFHDLRAKTGSDDPENAKGRLGHRSDRSTAVYLRKPKPVKPLEVKRTA